MRTLPALYFALGALPLLAQIDGTVINTTTGMPQAGVTVNLIHPSQDEGMQTLGTATSGPDGSFKIAQPLPSPPAILRVTFKGVEYNQVIPPGTPSTGLKLSVYETTNKFTPEMGEQHLIVVDSAPEGLAISETFLLQNSGKVTFSDPVNGSIQFYLPKAAQESTRVTINAPNGMPITRPPEKTSQPDVFKETYPIKPGQTQYDVGYRLPHGTKFTEKKLGSGPTILVTAETVQLSGEGLKDDGIKELGQGGPNAHVYEVEAKAGASYEVSVEGTGTLQSAQDASASGEESDDSGSPKPKAGEARVYERLPWVLGLAFGILALGGVLLYRRSPAA